MHRSKVYTAHRRPILKPEAIKLIISERNFSMPPKRLNLNKARPVVVKNKLESSHKSGRAFLQSQKVSKVSSPVSRTDKPARTSVDSHDNRESN